MAIAEKMDPKSISIQTASVLICEDYLEDERLTVGILRRLGPNFTLTVARNGEEALAQLGIEPNENAVRPNLIISDLKMPKLDGDQLVRRLRSESGWESIPFVVFSSSDEPDHERSCREAGADEYRIKPVDPRDYERALQEIVARWIG